MPGSKFTNRKKSTQTCRKTYEKLKGLDDTKLPNGKKYVEFRFFLSEDLVLKILVPYGAKRSRITFGCSVRNIILFFPCFVMPISPQVTTVIFARFSGAALCSGGIFEVAKTCGKMRMHCGKIGEFYVHTSWNPCFCLLIFFMRCFEM